MLKKRLAESQQSIIIIRDMKDLLFGKLKTYLILTDFGEFKIGGRGYTYRGGILTVKDCFTKVATFLNIKHITEV